LSAAQPRLGVRRRTHAEEKPPTKMWFTTWAQLRRPGTMRAKERFAEKLGKADAVRPTELGPTMNEESKE